MNNVHQLKQPAIFKLNRKQLRCIFKYLEIDELSKLRCTCRRLNNAVIAYVDKLQVFVNWLVERCLMEMLNRLAMSH